MDPLEVTIIVSSSVGPEPSSSTMAPAVPRTVRIEEAEAGRCLERIVCLERIDTTGGSYALGNEGGLTTAPGLSGSVYGLRQPSWPPSGHEAMVATTGGLGGGRVLRALVSIRRKPRRLRNRFRRNSLALRNFLVWR